MVDWHDKRVCVTGGTGFLGFHLVRQLRALGARVHVLALPPSAQHPIHELSDVECTYGDVQDREVIRRAVLGCPIIFHTAGVVGFSGLALERMRSVHVEGTRNVLSSAEPGTRIVHTSSIVAVGAAQRDQPVHEDSRWDLQDCGVDYIHAKRAAEELVLDAAARGQDVVVVNPSFLVGPEDYEGSGLTRFCQRFWKGRVLFAPAGGLNLADVRDVAAGHILAAERGLPGRRYLLGGEDLAFAKILQLLADVAGLRPRFTPCVPWWMLRAIAGLAELRSKLSGRPAFPAVQELRLNRHCWFCSSARAMKELTYRPRPAVQALADLHDWFALEEKLRLRGLNRWWMRPLASRSQRALPIR